MTLETEHTRTIQPKILYYGTPVVLLTTLNKDLTVNISPISSSWALGEYLILGVGTASQAYENLSRHPECVINLPSCSMWENVERLAPFTGKYLVPEQKQKLRFTYQKDKFAACGLTSTESVIVKPSCIAECPIQIEAEVKQLRVPEYDTHFGIVETHAVCIHAHNDILIGEKHVDPNKWNPLLYNFRHYFGLGEELGKTFRSET